MTRREYLTALNQYLVTMSESEKMAILKEYDDHFRKGFEAGKTESQVCASLGAPYDVANEFLEGRHPKAPTYPTQSRPQTAQPRPQTHSSSDYIGSSHRQTSTTRTGVSQPRPQTSSAPASTQTPQDIFSEPTYPQPQRPAYSEPSYPQTPRSAYVPDDQAYVDYDRAESEREIEPKKKKRESKYSMTGIIVVAVIGVLLVPTMGFAIYYLVRGLYELLRAFPGTGVALIAAGGSLSANSLWICLGLIFIGISFLALTGLLIMAIIEITKLFIKLFRYILKECKKMIKEGSF